MVFAVKTGGIFLTNFAFRESENGVRFGYFPVLVDRGLKHGFSARKGGVSKGDFSSLNLGFKTGDAVEQVDINCERFCQSLGICRNQVVMAGQVHGIKIARVDSSMAGTKIANTDGLITNDKGLGLMLFFADCVPLILFDPVQQVLGICHAGWKGTLFSIGIHTLEAMKHVFGTDPSDCIVGIGPSIGPENYEIDYPVWSEIRNHWTNLDDFCKPGRPDHWLLDLWSWNQIQFCAAGVLAENMLLSGISTAQCPDQFFSHRASQGRTGRFGLLAYL